MLGNVMILGARRYSFSDDEFSKALQRGPPDARFCARCHHLLAGQTLFRNPQSLNIILSNRQTITFLN